MTVLPQHSVSLAPGVRPTTAYVIDLRQGSAVQVRDPLWSTELQQGETVIVREYAPADSPEAVTASAGVLGRGSIATGDDVRPALRLVTPRPGSGHAEAPEPTDAHELIRALARDTPYVIVDAPEVPTLTGDLVADVRALCGLSMHDLAVATGVGTRAAAFWVTRGPSERARPILEGLRAIGAVLIESLGADGIKAWLKAGAPSRLDRIRGGETAAVAAEAREYLETVIT